jgi:hypothetical protein
MLLRRINEHVKEQNWFAVVIDFIVVVVGIFIGLQVSDWNQERLDRKIEATYLLALQQDLEATAANYEKFLRDNTVIRDNLVSLATLEKGIPPELMPVDLDRMLASALWDLAILRIQMDAYDDMKFSVGTKLLGSQPLRLELSRFDSLLERYFAAERDMQEVQYRNMDPYLADNFPVRRFAGVFSNADGLPEAGGDPPDYVAVIGDMRTQSRLTMKFIGVNNTAGRARELGDSVEKLHGLIADRLYQLGYVR